MYGFNVINMQNPKFHVYVYPSTPAYSDCGQHILMFFIFQGNYYFASNKTPVFERYPSRDDLNSSIFFI